MKENNLSPEEKEPLECWQNPNTHWQLTENSGSWRPHAEPAGL
jgi:hypothetical protein